MRDKKPLRKLALGAVVCLLGLIAGGIFFISDSAVLKSISAFIVAGYFVFLAASDWIEARLNEKHVEANPHLLRNDAIGEAVKVSGAFEVRSGTARGTVLLHGERWKASCSGSHVPETGDTLIVCGREGLTLVVRPQGRAV